MEFFQRAKAVRLKSVHERYLTADDDEDSIKQTRNGSTANARWTVEFIEGKPNTIRLKSSKTWKYLRASEDPFLLGMTGKRAVQGAPHLRSDPSVEWEPVREGLHVKLRAARRGNFLRANGRIWPWRNSVTHDSLDASANQDWILWVVDLLEFDHSGHHHHESPLVLSSSVSLPVRSGSGAGGDGSGDVKFGRVESDLSEESSVASSRSSASEMYRSGRPAISPQIKDSSASIQRSHFKTMPNHVTAAPPESSDDDEDDEEDEGSYYEDSEDDDEIFEEEGVPPGPDIHKAEQTLDEARNLTFTSAYESGQLDKIEEAIATLTSHGYRFGPPTQQRKSLDLHAQIDSLRAQQGTISKEYEAYKNFEKKRSKMNAGVQEIVDKVKRLQSFEEEHEAVVEAAREKREELLRQLKEAEEEVKAAEAVVEEDKAGVDQLCNLIGKKQVAYMEMEREAKTLLGRKAEADRKMEQVESDWASIMTAVQTMEKTT